MLDLERKGYLETKGMRWIALRSLRSWDCKKTKSGELGLFRRSSIHELPSHLSSESRNAQQVLEMDE